MTTTVSFTLAATARFWISHLTLSMPRSQASSSELVKSPLLFVTVQRKPCLFLHTKEGPHQYVLSALVGATDANGKSILEGREVTGFTDAEEEAAKMGDTIPFLVETRVRELGGKFVSDGELWGVCLLGSISRASICTDTELSV